MKTGETISAKERAQYHVLIGQHLIDVALKTGETISAKERAVVHRGSRSAALACSSRGPRPRSAAPCATPSPAPCAAPAFGSRCPPPSSSAPCAAPACSSRGPRPSEISCTLRDTVACTFARRQLVAVGVHRQARLHLARRQRVAAEGRG